MIPLLFRAKTATLLLLPPVTRPGEGNDKWNVLLFGCGILSQTEVPHTYAPAMLSKPEIKPHHGLHDMTVRWPAFLTAGRDEKYGLDQSLYSRTRDSWGQSKYSIRVFTLTPVDCRVQTGLIIVYLVMLPVLYLRDKKETQQPPRRSQASEENYYGQKCITD